MICRNCSALIEDGSKKCPVCHKDPGRRGSNGKGKGIFVVILVLLLIGAAAYLVFSNLDLVRKKVSAFLPAPTTSNATTLNFNDTGVAETESTTRKETETKPVEKISLLKAKISTHALKKGDNKVAAYGTLELQKAQLKALTHTQFSDFCVKRVSQSELAWLTLKCEDGTGIVFSGNCITTAVYGTLDANDCIKEALGTILLSSAGKYICISPDGLLGSVEITVTEKQTETAATKAPAGSTKSENTSDEKNTKDSAKVVFVESGSKTYHKSSCKLLSKSKKSIEKSVAVKNGYTPCKKCKP